MQIGTMKETSSQTALGIIQYEDNEIYTDYYIKENTPVVFEITKCGPNDRIKRAVNVSSYNGALEELYYNHKSKDFNPRRTLFKIFLLKSISTDKLSPSAKKGLNLYHNYYNLK